MIDLNSAEYIFLLSIGKIAAIVYALLHLLAIIVISRQTAVVSRIITTHLKIPIMIFSLLHVILLFLILVLTVIVNPAA